MNVIMKLVPRTVSLIKPDCDPIYGQDGLSLRDFDSSPGYILLGEPGMGKSTEFGTAADGIDGAHLISARRFIRSNLDNHPEWRTKTIFIDGLDEMRAGGGDPRSALDRIIHGLEALGTPKFRLSCRSGSWLGSGDLKEFSSLLGKKEIPVLQLNPLNYDGIRMVISQRGVDENTAENIFIERAHEYGMGALLGNPQLLDFLITSIKSEGWPGSQLKMFESACRELVQERNAEHRDARSFESLPSLEAILTAAGLLSAYMLIANKSGWAKNDTDDSEMLSLHDLEFPQGLPIQAAYDSRLFEGQSSSKTPIHRIVAEFLGARYLNQKIQSDLSVQRVLATLMGHNGTLLPDLRGLAAWLAALNDQARAILTEIDPRTVAFNGDTSGFSTYERKKLLVKLEQQIHLSSDWPSTPTLYALMGNEDSSIIQEFANSPERSKNRQTLVYMLLRGITKMYFHTGASDRESNYENLLNIVRDHHWKSDVRCEALAALNRILHCTSWRSDKLQQILTKLQKKNIEDENHDLQGALLHLMYPSELQPAEIWDYLVMEPATDHYSGYQNFFANLTDRSNDYHIKELLNSLCDRASEVVPKLEGQRVADVVIQFLARGLELFGDELCTPELYRWFELVEYDYSISQLIPAYSSRPSFSRHDKANTAIRDWLGQRENIQYALIEHGLLRKDVTIENASLFRTIIFKFAGNSAPEGFRLWCLERSIQLWNSNQNVAQELASWSVQAQEGWGLPLSDEEVAEVISAVPGLVQWNDQRLKNRVKAEHEIAEIKKKQKKIQGVYQKQKQDKLESLREQQAELAKGQCTPIILDELADIYFNNPNTREDNPQTCLRDYFEGDEELVKATLAGFRSLLNRDDLPDLDRITQLDEESRGSYYALPFLAGMEEVFQTSNDLNHLSETEIRRALGFYLTTELPRQQYFLLNQLNHHDTVPAWYKQTLECSPKAVADALVSVHNASVRSKNPPHAHMYEMAFDSIYAHIAKLAIPRMFAVFPSRCSARKLESLRVILWGVILNNGLPTEELKKNISRRLNRKQMDIGQRAQWLGAGLSADRGIYISMLIKFLSTGEETRVRHVIDFLVPTGLGQPILQNINEWSSDEIRQLVQVFGKRIQPPVSRKRAGLMSDDQRISRKFQLLFTFWIGELKKRICDEARKDLDILASEIDLLAWRREIVLAQEEQARRRRATKDSDLSLAQIHEVFHSQEASPANAADLTALTLDVLEELIDDIRNDPASAWRQYWDWGQSPRKPLMPKPENDCRDILLFSLASKLKRYQIDVQPEGHYADDRRADIRISYGSNLAIPIEIKKNSHRDLWRAIVEQLVQKYTRDPKSDGYGIYLVFWFGADRKYMRVVPPEGGTPKKPSKLRELLEKRLDPELRGRIHVAVVDVAPGGRFVQED